MIYADFDPIKEQKLTEGAEKVKGIQIKHGFLDINFDLCLQGMQDLLLRD